MRYETIAIGKPVQIGERRITALPANHAVPAVGYQLDSGTASLVFTGDTTINDPFWEIVNGIGNLRYLIIETAFSNKEREIAVLSKHLCPSMLQEELTKLKRPGRNLHHTFKARGGCAQSCARSMHALATIKRAGW